MPGSAGLDAVFASLPVINGQVEGGIAAGLDESLAHDDRLPILKAADGTFDQESAKAFALRWAYQKFENNPDMRKLAVCAVVVVFDLGLIALDDSDVAYVGPDHPLCSDDANDAAIKELTNHTGYSRAATVILATKASWWLTNHHTGQGRMAGYPSKVAKILFEDTDPEIAAGVFHKIGHWASTREVLRAAGIEGLKQSRVLFEAKHPLTLSDDAKLRFAGFPSGTHKIANAYAGARRLVGSMYLGVTPDAASIRDVVKPYERVRADRAFYHVGAQFLTGAPRRDAGEDVAEGTLGRIGTFLRIVMPRSSLTDSPHFTSDRVQSYPDFDADFEARLTSLKAKQATMSSDGMDRLVSGFEVFSARLAQDVASAFGVPVAYGIGVGQDQGRQGAEVGAESSEEEDSMSEEEVAPEPVQEPKTSKKRTTHKRKAAASEGTSTSKRSRKK